MTTSIGAGEDAALRFIGNDMLFARRYLRAAVEHTGVHQQAHVPIFCMTNYLSLYIHESHRALQRINPQIAAELTVGHAQIIERSRHTVKLFDDTNPQYGGLDGVTAQFAEIIRQHREYFLGNTWLPPARVLETDIAVYRYRGQLIATTHAINFYTGLPPESSGNPSAMGQVLKSLAESQARYIASLTSALPWEGLSFMDTLDLDKLTNRDQRAARFYTKSFDTNLPEAATATLSAFQAALNFLDLIVSVNPDEATVEAIFKLKFMTLYHILSSLAKFKDQHGATLSRASVKYLDAILTLPFTAEITRSDRKGLRNTLIHYIPPPQIALKLSLDRPLCGLVEAYYPDSNYADMSSAMDECTQRTTELLNEWSNRR